ncbi:Hypothetical_protein [Hexamita inflata]|uniref:Hypothetical_protein n=1 Tax=Hexamita inflata TaxID=28002 RepID=A0AA86QDU5_9EUKA|nr:Hypothetical protein HINF_LOCUS38947 [Hexamita inflata]
MQDDKQNNSPLTSHNLSDKIIEQQNQIKDKSNSLYKKLKADEASESTSLRDNLSIVTRHPKSPQSSEQRASQKLILHLKIKQEIVPMQQKLYALQYKKVQRDEKMILERQRDLQLECEKLYSEFSEMSETDSKIEENQGSYIRKQKLMQKTVGVDPTEELKQEIATLKLQNESDKIKITRLLDIRQKESNRNEQQQALLRNRVKELEDENLMLMVFPK